MWCSTPSIWIWHPASRRTSIHHSDQGSQYTSLAFGNRLQGRRRPTIDRLGRRRIRQRDVRELLRTLECELLDQHVSARTARPGRRLPLHRGLLQPSRYHSRFATSRQSSTKGKHITHIYIVDMSALYTTQHKHHFASGAAATIQSMHHFPPHKTEIRYLERHRAFWRGQQPPYSYGS